jgi:outer membrane protein OmpA-like peptidoglycan-associated protein
MNSPKDLRRHFATGLVLVSILVLSSSCVASRKFVRGEVHTSADQLNARVDKTDGNLEKTDSNVKEMNDRVVGLDARTNEQGRKLDSVNGELQKTNSDLQKTGERTTQAQTSAEKAQTSADQARGRVVTLEENFQNRNQYTVTAEQSVLFPFNSATLKDTAVLDQVAEMAGKDPDALIVLEGRTDSNGNDTYNVQLGERRAEAVKRYLVVEKSVSMYRIHQTSFGAAKPIADNKSREGREKNRAVVVSVMVPRFAASDGSKASNSQ